MQTVECDAHMGTIALTPPASARGDPPKTFTFDAVYGPDTVQANLYQATVNPVVALLKSPPNPLAHLPAPFCEIARIEGNRAFTADGTFVAELPKTVADDLVLALLSV